MRTAIPLLFVLSIATFTASAAPELEDLLQYDTVTILGETHRREDSTTLVSALIASTLDRLPCITVALEIPEDQQPALDAAMNGGGSIEDVTISPIIEHAGIRSIIRQLQTYREHNDCVTAWAIDAAPGSEQTRDATMARHLQELAATKRPVFALLGSLHAAKRLRWTPEANGQPSAAERLQAQGITVRTILQEWPAGQCEPRAGRYISTRDPEGAAAVVRTLAVTNTYPEPEPDRVYDGVVLWECARDTVETSSISMESGAAGPSVPVSPRYNPTARIPAFGSVSFTHFP